MATVIKSLAKMQEGKTANFTYSSYMIAGVCDRSNMVIFLQKCNKITGMFLQKCNSQNKT